MKNTILFLYKYNEFSVPLQQQSDILVVAVRRVPYMCRLFCFSHTLKWFCDMNRTKKVRSVKGYWADFFVNYQRKRKRGLWTLSLLRYNQARCSISSIKAYHQRWYAGATDGTSRRLPLHRNARIREIHPLARLVQNAGAWPPSLIPHCKGRYIFQDSKRKLQKILDKKIGVVVTQGTAIQGADTTPMFLWCIKYEE